MYEEVPRKFDFGDRVTSRNTGLPAVGNIIAIMHPDLHDKVSPDSFKQWCRIYPDAKKGPVYYLRLDQPQPPRNKDECLTHFVQQHGCLPHPDLLKQIFDAQPVNDVIAYPEADLELL
jgi:hypothetical protein